MNRLLIVLVVFALAGCSNPIDDLKEMPPKIQRSALAELGRDALVDALREVESRTPVSFLKVDEGRVSPIQEVIQRETLFRSAVKRTVGHSFEGTIYNNALVANFKDFKIILYYDAANGSNISSEEFVIYRTVSAGSFDTFSVEIDRPDQTSSYRYVVTEAQRAN